MDRTVRDVQIVVEALLWARHRLGVMDDNVPLHPATSAELTRLNAEIARLVQSDIGRAPCEPADWDRYRGGKPSRRWTSTP